MSDVMTVPMQMTLLQKQSMQMQSKNPDFDPQTIDFEAEIDPTLSYPENLDNFKRKYQLREVTSEAEYKDRAAHERLSHPENNGYAPKDRYAGKSMAEIAYMKHKEKDYILGSPNSPQRSQAPKVNPPRKQFFGESQRKRFGERHPQIMSFFGGVQKIGGHMARPVINKIEGDIRRNRQIGAIQQRAYSKAFNRAVAAETWKKARIDARRVVLRTGRASMHDFVFGSRREPPKHEAQKKKRKRLEGLFDW